MGALAIIETENLDVFACPQQRPIILPLIPGISAGFPSPAADFIDLNIDLSKEIVKNPSSTFFGRVKGDSMHGAGIDDGDIMVVDKSLSCKEGDIAVCFVDGEFTVKRIRFEKDACWLIAENDKYPPIRVTDDNEMVIWGIVISVIKFFGHVRPR
ncbi:LexA family protein [Dyadobacter bucti]|uniref:LexA family protein n=1 Tax=Dyadobacter bucti TaxID=2572203 RepID=UPI0011082577|nr:translesion error-prone DNA polymerase V autoproteolytic subunit [Dyadobacter bucti]